MRTAGPLSGAYVKNVTDGRVVFSWNADPPRILASNTKLFTTSAALARYGTAGTLGTEVLGRGQLDEDGVWRGDLYLRGGGDPTFGSRTFTRRSYGGGATVEELADALEQRGHRPRDRTRPGRRVPLRLRCAAAPTPATAPRSGSARSARSPSTAAWPTSAGTRVPDESARVRGHPAGRGARGARDRRCAASRPPGEAPSRAGGGGVASSRRRCRALVRLTLNKDSDNFFAEMLAKDLALQARGRGTTRVGARLAAAFARRLGSRARLVDGSGLSRGDRASPYRVVRLLTAMLKRDEANALLSSLPIAGRDGTLVDRMRSGPARLHCHAKTGTLSDVSALSGDCDARCGRHLRLLDPDERHLRPAPPAASRTGWPRRSPRSATNPRRRPGATAGRPRPAPRCPRPAPWSACCPGPRPPPGSRSSSTPSP